ncbi:MAG: phosphopantetheine-binding protein [Oscillospiraceae bacterium]|jgi:acyl carrier protein|nr:phosphopantetheine-binding protein [Oscillospiraceae bacterium]
MNGFYAEIEEEVYSTIMEVLAEIIGEDELEIVGITRDSSFVLDLMIDSIQFVVLAEKIEALYGDRVDFTE